MTSRQSSTFRRTLSSTMSRCSTPRCVMMPDNIQVRNLTTMSVTVRTWRTAQEQRDKHTIKSQKHHQDLLNNQKIPHKLAASAGVTSVGSSGFYAKRILRSSGLYERPQRLLNDSGFTNPRKRVLLWFIHRGDRLQSAGSSSNGMWRGQCRMSRCQSATMKRLTSFVCLLCFTESEATDL